MNCIGTQDFKIYRVRTTRLLRTSEVENNPSIASYFEVLYTRTATRLPRISAVVLVKKSRYRFPEDK